LFPGHKRCVLCRQLRRFQLHLKLERSFAARSGRQRGVGPPPLCLPRIQSVFMPAFWLIGRAALNRGDFASLAAARSADCPAAKQFRCGGSHYARHRGES
jgi:hypothetical protein